MLHLHPFRVPLLALLLILLGACAGRKPLSTAYASDPRWAVVDSLEKIGQYATALEKVEGIREGSAASGDWRNEFKAWVRRAGLQQMTGVERTVTLKEIGDRARTATTPLAQLLHSIRAEGWWSYYSDERWEIMERTELADGGSDDPETWTQQRFMTEVRDAFTTSLQPWDTLRATPVDDLGELLDGDLNARYLRPTLYDLLAHRALAVMVNPETRISEASWQFKLDDPSWFDLFEPFALRSLVHRDSTSSEFQAMRILQRLERQHLSDDKLDAYVDVAMNRLSFVRQRSTLANKDSLYLSALELLRTRVPLDACEAEVMVAIAEWHAGMADQYDRLVGDAWKWERRTARELCIAAVVKWPGSFGARNAKALIARQERPALDLQSEQASPPGQDFLAALRYANTKRVWLRVVKDPFDLNKSREPDYNRWLLAQKWDRQWSIELPDDGDLNSHLVEVPVAGSPLGRYAIIVSNGEGFHVGADVMSWCSVQVTNLAVVDRTDGHDMEALVLDRTSGIPKAGVRVNTVVRNPIDQAKERYIRSDVRVTDDSGRVKFTAKQNNGELRLELMDGVDVFTTDAQWMYDRGRSVPDSLRTFLFTDRAIYRPGQEVFFKGIVTVERGKGTATKEAYKTTVFFNDANGEVVDSVQVVSDPFGSFHGRFIAPLGRLTGQWSLNTTYAYKPIRIEEYKRPMFEAVFDPISTTPKLGAAATVSGVAKSYAGAPLDGAVVKYVVRRGANMPWWCGWGWRGLPWGLVTEIANGETICDAQGKFNVAFQALPDNNFPRASDPTFSYSVEAWVTDINGETQQANTSLTIGYRSIDLDIALGDALDRSIADSLLVRVTNLNGQRVDVPFDVRIVRLDQPAGGVKRERLWDRPDRFILTPDSFAMRFPDDVYANESDPSTWAHDSAAFAHHAALPFSGPIPIHTIRDQVVGTYLVEVEATDPEGNLVKASKVFTLFDPEIQNTGFENEAFHVQVVKGSCEPGEKAVLVLSSALPACRVLMEVERDGVIVISRPFTLSTGQQRVELPVVESDRGGFTVHFVCVERGRDHKTTEWIDVPWTNKQLKVEWTSFRDKLLPGAKEEWRLKITGAKKEKVAAQLLAAMYDASLDVFEVPNWWMDIWHSNLSERGWDRSELFGTSGSRSVYVEARMPSDSTRVYPGLVSEETLSPIRGNTRRRFRTVASPSFGGDADESPRSGYAEGMDRATTAGLMDGDASGKLAEAETSSVANNQQPTSNNTPSPLRTDFRETAFFFPDLLTDRNGDVVLRFTMPDALTRWNFMGLAHTKDLQLAQFSRSTITQKPLMVMPNLPRFLRQGDRITLAAKINVIEGGSVNGTAQLELFDPRTNAAVSGAFGLNKPSVAFTADPGASANVQWTLRIPEDLDVVAVRITASAPGINDGEERVLPILTDRVLVTESVPLSITKAGTKTFTLPNLVNATSTTLKHHSLTLEYTPNPAWYAVQALPYLMEFPHECAEQIFSRYYANHLAAHIVKERPTIKKVFAAWSAGTAGNEGAFLSALEKNPELKSAVLEETPWVLNAKDEGERKRRIALFFDLHRMANEDANALRKLQEMQLPDGSWPWWSGMQPSRYITQHIVAGFGHLQQLDAFDLDPDTDARRMVQRAVAWLDRKVEEDHQRMLRDFKGDTIPMPSSEDVHYLYARSSFPQYPLERGKKSAAAFIIERVERYWMQFGLQEQAMIAIALHRMADEQTPKLITTSLAQRATMNDELGMYWKDFRIGYRWNEFPTELNALMIEAFEIVAHDREKVNSLRQHLLKLKQTTDWKTTKATADACYALLLTGDDWLEPKSPPVIKVGEETVQVANSEAGTGYIQQSWPGTEVKPSMGNVTVTTTSDGVQWGALHWQYFERMDKVPAHESPFSIRRQVMLKEQTESGPKLVALDASRTLKPGDRLTVRVELRTDRYLDYVHMKDLRAAGLEPVQALSGYQWKGGLGYYQSIRDAAMHFFFDRIAPGTYVFEYDLKVTHAGDFSNGITSVQCMYAPEFASHSEGVRIKVGE